MGPVCSTGRYPNHVVLDTGHTVSSVDLHPGGAHSTYNQAMFVLRSAVLAAALMLLACGHQDQQASTQNPEPAIISTADLWTRQQRAIDCIQYQHTDLYSKLLPTMLQS